MDRRPRRRGCRRRPCRFSAPSVGSDRDSRAWCSGPEAAAWAKAWGKEDWVEARARIEAELRAPPRRSFLCSLPGRAAARGRAGTKRFRRRTAFSRRSTSLARPGWGGRFTPHKFPPALPSGPIFRRLRPYDHRPKRKVKQPTSHVKKTKDKKDAEFLTKKLVEMSHRHSLIVWHFKNR